MNAIVSPKDQPSVSALDAASLPRHRWYFFKEAFSPEIVDHAIRDTTCGDDDLIVDPFSGSGTTALAAAQQGRQARGSEVNPFLAFVAQAKLTTPPKALLANAAENIMRSSRDGLRSHLHGFSTFTRSAGADKWLFNHSVLSAFTAAWAESERVPTRGRSAIRLALLGAAMDACNAVKDGKCLRYRSNWKKLSFRAADFRAAFETRIEDIIADIESVPLESGIASIRVADSRYSAVAGGRKFRLCVMSPPYLNSFDYTDVYRPELFLGGFVRNMEELRRLRLQSVRSHVQVKWRAPREQKFGSHFASAYAAIEARAENLWNRRLPTMLCAYFEDMLAVLKSLRSEAAENASLWIIVSTSAYGGVEIPVDLILADVGCQAGWSLRELRTLRHLRRVPVQQWDLLVAAARTSVHARERVHDGPHLRESLIILDANPKAG